MNIFQRILQLGKQKHVRRTIKEYQHDILVKQSRQQFEKLLKLGKIPVVLL